MRAPIAMLLLVCLALATKAVAQSALSLTLRAPSSDVVRLGQSLTLSVEAESGGEATLLELPEIANVRMRASAPNDSSSQQFVNGRLVVNRTVRTWTIELEPVEAGRYKMPPLRVRDGTGRVHETRSFTFECQAGPRSSAFLELVFEPSSAYVGENVQMRLRFGVEPQHVERLLRQSRYAQARDFTLDFAAWDEMPAGSVPDDAIESLPQDGVIVPVNRRYRLLHDLGVQKRGNDSFHMFEVRKTLRPERVGVFEMERATLRYSWASKLGRNVFGEVVATEQRDEFARSEPPRFEVRALPSEGQPKGFTGAVGTLKIDATLGKNAVQVGESFPFEMRLSGSAVHEGLEAPDLAKLDGFEGFHVFGKKLAFEDGALVARYDLSALRPGALTLPEIALPHFDTATGRYEIARAGPFGLDVSGTVAKGLEALPESRKALTPGVDDIWDRIDARGEAPRRFEPEPWHAWIALLAPLVLFGFGFGLSGFVARSRADVAGRRRRAARRVFDERLTTQGPLVALNGFIADRLGIEAGALVGADLSARLVRHGLSDERARDLEALVTRLEALRYAGSAADAEAELSREVTAAVEVLEKELRA